MLLSCHNKSLFNEHLSRGGGGGSSLARGAIRARSAAVSLHKNIDNLRCALCAQAQTDPVTNFTNTEPRDSILLIFKCSCSYSCSSCRVIQRAVKCSPCAISPTFAPLASSASAEKLLHRQKTHSSL